MYGFDAQLMFTFNAIYDEAEMKLQGGATSTLNIQFTGCTNLHFCQNIFDFYFLVITSFKAAYLTASFCISLN